MQLTELTPKRLRCGIGPCPAIFATDRGTYVIVGSKLTPEQVQQLLLGKVAPHEEAIEIPKGFFSEIGNK